MNQKLFLELYRDTLDLKITKQVNEFLKQGKIPLGTTRPPDDYETDKNGRLIVPDDEIIWYTIDETNFINIIMIAGSGVGKTRLGKRIMYYFNHNDYDCLVFEPKEIEWYSSIKKGDGFRLLKGEIKDKLNLQHYAPSFTLNDMQGVERQVYTDKNIHTLNIQKINTMMEWRTIGIKELSVSETIKSASRGSKGMQDIIRKIAMKGGKEYKKDDAIFQQTAKSLSLKLAGLKEAGLFNDDYKEINLKKYWDKKKVIVISYFAQDEEFIQLDIGKVILEAVRTNKQRGRKPIMIDWEDTVFYLTPNLRMGDSLALKQAVNCVSNYRSLGFNNMFVTQSPKKLHSYILESATDLFISTMKKYNDLNEYVTPQAMEALNEMNNMINTKKYIYPWMWFKQDNSFVIFYPFGSVVGHDKIENVL